LLADPNEVGKLDDVRFVRTENPKVFTAAARAASTFTATLIMGSMRSA
jgi:hypothetical protein